ncbi:MAG: hypothetical protein HOF72_06615 [Planctomycetaceae bacterium]|jgi:hypothetical protein|nr:hypothetical protein [Planctomycetaceae bacterium]MBT4724775.1 hypothetical protein [Planctomycetaceae bacterium]MBT5886149.1 hypothetical protein [Planctomycetaceae bacterium]MBT7257288.1 hypothetical protein [Planctomycetaceae bacterium]
MDRSFLSSDQLIKATRDFVCIRTATYEDKQEATFLEWAFVGNTGGSLRNFGYCILSPDGKTKLRRSTRGPNFLYANSGAMAADLRQISAQYSGRAITTTSNPAVPQMKNVRLGINVASCDGLPSVVVFGKDQTEVDSLNQKLSGVIWDEQLAGKFIYASTTNSSDLKSVPGAGSQSGILVIKPDAFGIKGQLITIISPEVSAERLQESLLNAANAFTRISKTHGLHVRNGRQTGTLWKTEIPIPARQRTPSRTRQNPRPR